MKKGAVMSMAESASLKPDTVVTAKLLKQAFITAAFSLSNNPIRPIMLDNVMFAPGNTSSTTSAALVSNSEFTGENTDEIAIALIPFALISSAIPRTSSGSNDEISRPSNSCPPWAI